MFGHRKGSCRERFYGDGFAQQGKRRGELRILISERRNELR